MALAIAALALLAVGGYAVWFQFAPGAARAEVVGEDPRVLVWQQRYSGMNALISGVLRYDPDTRCLYLDESSGSQVFGIVWPKGTRPVTEDGRAGVRINGILGRFGGTPILDGDRVQLGGGATSEVAEQLLLDTGCGYEAVWRVHEETQALG